MVASIQNLPDTLIRFTIIDTWMQTVAQSMAGYRLTGSSLLLGLVGFRTLRNNHVSEDEGKSRGTAP